MSVSSIGGRYALGAVAAAMALLMPARAIAQRAEGSFERALTVDGPVDLRVSTGSGSITVGPGPDGAVRVIGRIRAQRDGRSDLPASEKVRRLEADPPIVQNGNAIRIGHIEDESLRRNVSISYELVVPTTTSPHLRSGSGSQTIEGVEGPVVASTGSGSIRAREIGGELEASTGSGEIDVQSVRGAACIRTGSGSVLALGIGGAIVASTGSGRIELEQDAAGDVDVRSGSGSVRLRGVRGGLRIEAGSGSVTVDGQMTDDWRLHAASGSITIRLPAEAGFELQAHTNSGSIETTHPITVVGTVGRRELRGTVRGGGPLLDVSTSSGSIRIQ